MEAGLLVCRTAAALRAASRSNPDRNFSLPAQWAWFAWRPATTALPFRAPDGWGLTLEPPGPELADEIGAAPVYVLSDAEADWPALLDILLVSTDTEPWLRSIIMQRHETERLALKTRYAQRYGGGESAAFERFMQVTVAHATDPGDAVNSSASDRPPPVELRSISLTSYPHCTATVKSEDDGGLLFDLYDRDYLGSDRADMYRVAPEALPGLYLAMTQTTGDSPGTPAKLLASIGRHYPAWDDAFSWLKNSGVPFTHEVDPWA
ncbi:hypothetical protein [Pararobbsia alpina]|uniref:Uncharacterized protein n=1 Tax=Pararobbsia alpina TaxID=621374 RepID=A0A6S7BCU4_9BURK|nr:hypothetical protein [Pararobbsia alpina]CAB3795083.1 hypothetical protein LMG28138_03811 [Pararobbsia alpina]